MHDHPSHCRICGAPLTAHQSRSGGLCARWRCREADLAAAVNAERSRALAARSDGGVRDGLAAGSVLVPWCVAPLAPLPAYRRTAFLSLLDGLLAEAVSEERREDDSRLSPERVRHDVARERWARRGTGGDVDGEAPPLLAAVCAACQGACCHAGGTHAFLDAARIRGVLERHGGDADAVRAAYASRLPERSVRGSCVFHGQAGCALPRELRGALCNRYECRGLAAAREQAAAGASRIHVVRRADQEIHDSALVSRDGVDRVRARRAGAASKRGRSWTR